MGADLLEFAVLEVADVVSGKKKFKTAAKSVGRQTLRKQLGEGSRRAVGSASVRQAGSKQKTSIPVKSLKRSSRSRKDIFTNIAN